jgi:hypothetical protein
MGARLKSSDIDALRMMSKMRRGLLDKAPGSRQINRGWEQQATVSVDGGDAGCRCYDGPRAATS